MACAVWEKAARHTFLTSVEIVNLKINIIIQLPPLWTCHVEIF